MAAFDPSETLSLLGQPLCADLGHSTLFARCSEADIAERLNCAISATLSRLLISEG